MKCEKRIHPGWQEYEKASGHLKKFGHIFGKYQYIYSSKRGTVSLIQFVRDWYYPHNWEILCMDGNLFKDTERFKTKVEALVRIRELMK